MADRENAKGKKSAPGAPFRAREALAAAEAAARAGELGEAIRLFRAVLARMPRHAGARKALKKLEKRATPDMQPDIDRAVALVGAGRLAEAAPLVERLVRRAPGEAGLHNLLGIVRMGLGDAKGARTAFAAALALEPDMPEALANHGAAELALGDTARARASLEKAVTLNSQDPKAWHNLAQARAAGGDTEGALAALDRALAIRPDYANALNTKASILRATGRHLEAIRLLKQAHALNPQDSDIAVNLGHAHADIAMTEEAVRWFERALPARQQDAALHHVLGVNYGFLSRFEKARALMEKAIALEPNNPEYHRDYGTITRLAPEDERVRAWRARFEAPDASEEEVIHYGFALAKVWREAGDHAAEFGALARANAARRRQIPHSSADLAERFARIRDTLTPEWIARNRREGEGKGLVFIVGLNRSGTTLIETMLSNHPAVFGAGEQAHLDSHALASLDEMPKWSSRDRDAFAQAYLDLIAYVSRGWNGVITDKLPANFAWVGLIHTLFPEARIIHMERDPRDVALSNWRAHFTAPAHPWAYDLGEFPEFYAAYRAHMNHWHEILPGVVTDVRYEDLVLEPEPVMHGVLERLDLPWNEAVLAPESSRRAVQTASSTQVREKVHARSVGSWQRHADVLAPVIHGLEARGLLPEQA